MKLGQREITLIGEYLHDCRKAAGYTQNEVAEHLGYKTNQYVSNIERGICEPSEEFLLAVLELYEITPRDWSTFYLGMYRDRILEVFE